MLCLQSIDIQAPYISTDSKPSHLANRTSVADSQGTKTLHSQPGIVALNSVHQVTYSLSAETSNAVKPQVACTARTSNIEEVLALQSYSE